MVEPAFVFVQNSKGKIACRGLTMDLGDVTDFENAGDASERHDLVMKLASEGNHLILYCTFFCTKQ